MVWGSVHWNKNEWHVKARIESREVLSDETPQSISELVTWDQAPEFLACITGAPEIFTEARFT